MNFQAARAVIFKAHLRFLQFDCVGRFFRGSFPCRFLFCVLREHFERQEHQRHENCCRPQQERASLLRIHRHCSVVLARQEVKDVGALGSLRSTALQSTGAPGSLFSRPSVCWFMAEYATVFEEKKQMTRRFALVTSFCLAGAVLLSAGLPARSNAAKDDVATPAMKAVAGQGMLGSHAFEFLTELTDDIGARVSGTPAAARAADWGLATMKAMGLENVHPEKWQLSRGWTRVSAEAELLTPTPRHLTIDSLGWVGSTPPGGVESERDT